MVYRLECERESVEAFKCKHGLKEFENIQGVIIENLKVTHDLAHVNFLDGVVKFDFSSNEPDDALKCDLHKVEVPYPPEGAHRVLGCEVEFLE